MRLQAGREAFIKVVNYDEFKEYPMKALLRRFTGLGMFLVVWELVSRSGSVSSEYMPPLMTIFDSVLKLFGTEKFILSLQETVARSLIGLVCAVVIALTLAVVAARFTLFRRAFQPLADILRSLPPPAIVPLMVFVLGLGPQLFYFVTIFGCMWPTYISAANALSTAEPVQVNTAKIFGLNDSQILWQIRLPAAMPEIFTGIRLSSGIALLACIATEMLVGGQGLGGMLFDAGFSLLWGDMYALMFIIGALGVGMTLIMHVARKVLIGWQIKYANLGAAS